MFKSKKEVEYLRNLYKAGTVIELVSMDDPFAVPKGTRGVVQFVDDIGQIHMKWDNGSTLALNVDVDVFKVVKKGDD